MRAFIYISLEIKNQTRETPRNLAEHPVNMTSFNFLETENPKKSQELAKLFNRHFKLQKVTHLLPNFLERLNDDRKFFLLHDLFCVLTQGLGRASVTSLAAAGLSDASVTSLGGPSQD